jgi:DNA-binding NarL/FixJ family response regulator
MVAEPIPLTPRASAHAVPPTRPSPGAGPVPVLVVATDPLSRAGVISELRAGSAFTIAAEGSTSPDLIALVVADEIDAPTVTQIRALRARGVGRVVALVSRVDDKSLITAAEAGVIGVVRRSDATAANLTAAIRSAAAGDGVLPPDLLGRLLRQVGHIQRQVLSPRGLTFAGLTERELQVLRLLADGLDTAEVGQRLFYSERTVKNIIHDVTSRLELRNRTHAVAYAIREGLI